MKLCLTAVLLSASLFASDPQAIFERAVQALASADYPAAETGFLEVLRTDPRNIGALGNLGVVYSRTNQTAKAIAVYDRALTQSPRDPQLHLNLGLAYLKQDNYAAALPHFEEAVAGPNNAQARALLATCRLYTGEVGEALKELEVLRAQDPHSPGVLYLLAVGYIKNKQPVQAKAVLDEMFTSAATPARANFLLGKTYYDAAQFSEAEEFFTKASQLDPGLPGVQLELAKVYLSERRTDDAIASLRQLVTRHANDPEANYFLGGALVQNGNFAEAIPFLQTARRLQPEAWAVFFYLGKARFQLGQAAVAADLLKHARELNPLEPAVYYQLAKVLRAVGRGDEARIALQRVKELRSRNLDRETESLDSVPGLR